MKKIIMLLPLFAIITGCGEEGPAINEDEFELLGENYQDAMQDTIDQGESGFMDTGPLTYFFTETYDDSEVTMHVEDDIFIIEIDESSASGDLTPRIFEVDPGDTESMRVRRDNQEEPVDMINMK
jgi:hypothetical protein